MRPDFSASFPSFAALLPNSDPEEILPPRTKAEIADIEASLGVVLPDSYKDFLATAGGLWLLGGVVQMSTTHPFLHDFPAFEELSPRHQSVVQQRGGVWPPASQGMLCFAEYFLQADGDQVLFSIEGGLVDGEYPVFYYAHSDSPPRVTQVATSFAEWIETVCIQSFRRR